MIKQLSIRNFKSVRQLDLSCRMEDFETKAYVMTEEQKAQILEWSMDAFFNFDRLLPDLE